MILRIIFGVVWIVMSAWTATAATITSKYCDKNEKDQNKRCIETFGSGVELDLNGRISKGDLANLKNQYAQPALFACLDRVHPGRYLMMTPDEAEAFQKKWIPPHQIETEQMNSEAKTAEEKKCYAAAVPNRPSFVNGNLLISSTGGDVNEAMAIGRWVRENRLGVYAVRDCASACVWILASGLTRNIWADTTIRVHRPFFTINDSRVPSGLGLQKLLQESKAYFDEMGVPPELAERMFSTPPDEVMTMNYEHISYYRLDQKDMGFREEGDFVRAGLLGISREEYMVRMQHYNELNKLTPCPFDRQDTLPYHVCSSARLKALGLELP